MSKLTSGEINAQGYGIAPVVSSSNYDYRGIPKNQSPDNNKTTTQPKPTTGSNNTRNVPGPSGGGASGKIDTLYYQETGNERNMGDYKPFLPGGIPDPDDDGGGDDDDRRDVYTGGGGGDSGSSAPAIDTAANPYQEELDAAAATTNRLTKGVDMTEQIKAADQAWNNATQGYGQQANDILGTYQTGANQNLEQYQGNAQAIIDQLSNLTGKELADYAASTGQTIAQATQQINDILAGLQANLQPVEAGRVGRVDTIEKENILQQMTDNQRLQANQQVDYAVQQGVNELQRAEEDAQAQFQAQRDQIAGQERTALDNQALYSEMRGDRGGIGQAQYGAIQNNAATNQLTVNKEQTKLATDTARQIADLRAKGEFDKADKMLEISQEYLGKLMQLKQWADEMNISIDEFNIGVEQWEQEYNAKLQQALGELGMNAVQYTTGLNLDQQQYLTNQGLNRANTEAQQRLGLESDVNKQRQNLNDALAQYGLSNAQYMTNSDINRLTATLNAYMQNAQNMASTEMAAANITGAFGDKTQTLAAKDQAEQKLAAAAQQMIAAGVTPTDAQLKALGWNKDQYNAYKASMELAAAAARGGGGGGNTLYKNMQTMIQGGVRLDEMQEYLANQIASQGYSANDVKKSQALVGGLNSTNYHGYASVKQQ